MAEEEIQLTTGEGSAEGNTDADSRDSSSDSPEVVALKAQLADSEAKTLKVENDKKAVEGRLRKDQDLATQFADLKAEAADDRRATQATLKALAAGETDGLPQQLQTIESQSAQGRANRNWVASWNSLMDDMDAIVADEDGEPVLDYNTDKGLDAWRSKVSEAKAQYDVASIAATFGELGRYVTKARAATFDEKITAARKEEQELAKAKMEKAGIHDLSSGAGAGGAGDNPRPALSKADRMAAGIAKLKSQGKDFAINPGTQT